VLKAQNLSDKEIEGAIRFSFSEFNTIEEMDYVLDCLKAAVNKIRRLGSFR
jgi:cysteine desulfurase